MRYDSAVIRGQVCRILSRHRGRSRTSIARELGVDRHTVTRDVNRAAGSTFRALQVQYMPRESHPLRGRFRHVRG
jgi:hypothetical protein